MPIEHIFAQRLVESLNEGIMIGLAGLDVLLVHIIVLAPLFKCLTKKLGAIVRPNEIGQAIVTLDLPKDAH